MLGCLDLVCLVDDSLYVAKIIFPACVLFAEITACDVYDIIAQHIYWFWGLHVGKERDTEKESQSN